MRSFVVLLALASCSPRPAAAPSERSEPDLASTPRAAPEPVPSAPEPDPVAEPEPEPEPFDPFPGRTKVTVAELLAALEAELDSIAASPAVRADYERLLADFELDDDDELYRDYVRVKLAFEATRAGGLWGLTWQITNELPQSDLVWAQWRALALSPEGSPETLPETTAIAECDELSALFAYVVHRIGLSKRSEVGLLWPTSNHVVAVWTLDRKSDRPTRIVVPNSQIFLGEAESLGTREFDPWRQKTIYDYRREDAEPELELPATLARALVGAVHEQGGRSQAELQAMRNEREARQWAALAELESE